MAARLASSQKLNLTFTDALIERIVARCTEVETGARAIDHIIRKTILPMIATEILHRMSIDAPLQDIALDVGPGGDFVIAGSENPSTRPPERPPLRTSAGSALLDPIEIANET